MQIKKVINILLEIALNCITKIKKKDSHKIGAECENFSFINYSGNNKTILNNRYESYILFNMVRCKEKLRRVDQA